jgi:hypothetical protein
VLQSEYLSLSRQRSSFRKTRTRSPKAARRQLQSKFHGGASRKSRHNLSIGQIVCEA